MSALFDAQVTFTQDIAKLLQWAFSNGFKLTFSEAWRSPEEAKIQAAKGAGITHSLHLQRLAVDLNVFDKDGKPLTTVAAIKPLGEFWKSLRPGVNAWGGDFKTRPDADHFSRSWQGYK